MNVRLLTPVALATALCAAGTVPAHAAPPSQKPVTLEQLSPLPPTSTSSALPIEFRAGWPLIFRASVKAKDMLGLGRAYGPQGFDRQPFEEIGQGGAIVFTNPDGLWSYAAATNYPHDERLLDFYPDQGDVSGVLDDAQNAPFSHDPVLKFGLRPEFGGPLPQYIVNPGAAPVLAPATADGVQFGADDDFPGLVVLSNVGVGIVFDDFADGWNPVLPRQARNLAGFSNSVGYELSDRNSRTSITSVMIVPRYLFSHVRVVDSCTGTITYDAGGLPLDCSGSPMQRIDGGPATPLTTFDESQAEIRAFVVEPAWNSVSGRLDYLETVVDMNGDGLLTAADAQAMGWRVLSNEIVTRIRQIGNDLSGGPVPHAPLSMCNGYSRPDRGDGVRTDLFMDVDGNGLSLARAVFVCPGGNSGVTQPPR